MAELRTKIILRNDSTTNWLSNANQVLLKGEVGIEFLDDGKTKIKIGDGVKTWEQLDYFGGDVSGLQTDINILQSIVGADASGENPATGLFALLNEKADSEDVYTKTETDSAIAAAIVDANHLERKIVASIDEIDLSADRYIYMVPSSNSESGNDYDEYMVINGALERVGNTAVDLSGYVPTEQFDSVKNAVDGLPLIYLTKEQAKATMPQVEYEISNKPTGTLVDYRDKEIRVMCPADTAWALQNVGENGDSSRYYIGFKAYAPNDSVVSFKEDTKATIEDDTMYYFEGNDFAGIDQYGRKYSIVWLPVAAYNSETDTWTYYGANSSTEKFIGWYYSVEWYNAEGKVVKSDTIRINLSNELCHNSIAPFYISDAITGVKVGGTILDIINKQVNIPVATDTLLGVVMSSVAENKIAVATDGTMEVNSINVNKLVQTDSDTLILNGGNSVI